MSSISCCLKGNSSLCSFSNLNISCITLQYTCCDRRLHRTRQGNNSQLSANLGEHAKLARSGFWLSDRRTREWQKALERSRCMESTSEARRVSSRAREGWGEVSEKEIVCASRESPKKDFGEKQRGQGGDSRRAESRRKLESRGGRKQRNSDESLPVRKGFATVAVHLEAHTLLQAEEAVPIPTWSTFLGSSAGVWEGVGAVFSPISGAMEPISLGPRNEYLYDAHTKSYVTVEDGTQGKAMLLPAGADPRNGYLRQRVTWMTENSEGETGPVEKGREVKAAPHVVEEEDEESDEGEWEEVDPLELLSDAAAGGAQTGSEGQTGVGAVTEDDDENVMEETVIGCEPGLIFYEDGSFSRGPVSLLPEDDGRGAGTAETLNGYHSPPTFRIEQCLVRGGHRRLRMVHTMAVWGKEEIQVLRVAVYDEVWARPCGFPASTWGSEESAAPPPFSRRERTYPQALAGEWKVFELAASVLYPSGRPDGGVQPTPPLAPPALAFSCKETAGKRSAPSRTRRPARKRGVSPDIDDVSLLWLPGGVTSRIEIDKKGAITIGVGWMHDDTRLAMEREYDKDGFLREVRSISEIKGGWVGGRME